MNLFKAYFLLATQLFVVAVLCMITKPDVKKFRFFDEIYGNKIEGIDGFWYDDNYKNNEAKRWYAKYCHRYYWSAIRNPLNNYLRNQGPNGIVTGIWEDGDTLFATIDGKTYSFKQTRLLWNFYWWSGTKLLEDWRIDPSTGKKYAELKLGSHFENQMILWALKNNKTEHQTHSLNKS